MIQPKPKLCRYEGCNNQVASFPNSTIKRKYCHDHFIEFAIAKSKEQIAKSKIIEKKEKTIELLSADGYRQKYIQPIINEIARLIDYGCPCIATGSMNGKMSGGHFWSVGSNRTTCLNLHNIHIQSFHSNSALGGDNIRYREGIIKVYGIDYMNKIESLKLLKPLKLTKDDFIEIKRIASEIRNELRQHRKYCLELSTPEERIKMREEINNKIGIYESLF